MAYVLFAIWSQLFTQTYMAYQKTGLQAQSLFVCSCIQLFCLTHKAIDFLTGGSYINCDLLVGLTIKVAISVFTLAIRKAQRELLLIPSKDVSESAL